MELLDKLLDGKSDLVADEAMDTYFPIRVCQVRRDFRNDPMIAHNVEMRWSQKALWRTESAYLAYSSASEII